MALLLLLTACGAANTGGGSSNPDPLKNKDGRQLYKEEFGRASMPRWRVNMIQRAEQFHDRVSSRGQDQGDGCLPTRSSQRGWREVESPEPLHTIIGADDDRQQEQLMRRQSSGLARGMAQCLHQLTGLRVIVHNDDGTCADCGSLQRTSCISTGDPPPGPVVVLGGGEDKRLRFLCANHYCGNTGDPFWVDAGRNAPHDYLGACDAYAFDRQGNRILGSEQVSLKADPPTKIAWLPLVNPHAEIRGFV